MKNRLLSFITVFLLLSTTLCSCLKEKEDDTLVFLGSESYFKFYDEFIPDKLKEYFIIHYKDSLCEVPIYDYLQLENSVIAPTMEGGQYRVKQRPFKKFPDPKRDDHNGTDFPKYIRFFNQNNSILSAEMLIDTSIITKFPNYNYSVKFHIKEECKVDTMFVVGDDFDNGHFMMYGNAEYNLLRRIEFISAQQSLPPKVENYEYKTQLLIVGRKGEKGIERIAVFDHLYEDKSQTFPEGSIRAFGDENDFSPNYY